jgi:hypothetical protein
MKMKIGKAQKILEEMKRSGVINEQSLLLKINKFITGEDEYVNKIIDGFAKAVENAKIRASKWGAELSLKATTDKDNNLLLNLYFEPAPIEILDQFYTPVPTDIDGFLTNIQFSDVNEYKRKLELEEKRFDNPDAIYISITDDIKNKNEIYKWYRNYGMGNNQKGVKVEYDAAKNALVLKIDSKYTAKLKKEGGFSASFEENIEINEVVKMIDKMEISLYETIMENMEKINFGPSAPSNDFEKVNTLINLVNDNAILRISKDQMVNIIAKISKIDTGFEFETSSSIAKLANNKGVLKTIAKEKNYNDGLGSLLGPAETIKRLYSEDVQVYSSSSTDWPDKVKKWEDLLKMIGSNYKKIEELTVEDITKIYAYINPPPTLNSFKFATGLSKIQEGAMQKKIIIQTRLLYDNKLYAAMDSNFFKDVIFKSDKPLSDNVIQPILEKVTNSTFTSNIKDMIIGMGETPVSRNSPELVSQLLTLNFLKREKPTP